MQAKSVEERKRERELDEARKAGTVPAERDADGNEINPHIPQFMSQAPWYLNAEGPGLQHQKNLKTKKAVAGVADFIPRGMRAGPAATIFRKGACTNCGAMTHKAKDCVERPRKKGAKYSGSDIKADEVVVEMAFDYAGKRDHWAQYDPSDHTKRIEEYDREMEVDESEQVNVGTKMNANRNGGAKMSVRNLRIREDTAKYLLNLDVNSAYFDPKTRSMRENPLPHAENADFVPYNQMKRSGDARELAALQLYELEAHEAGQSLHLNADPTTAELMNKIYREKKEKLQSSKVNKVLEKYGGAEHLAAPPAELLYAQTEEYVEYTKAGAVVSGRERAIAKSKYEEDVHTNNHTAVWGSFFDRQTFRWGYADDHATVRNAYGTGEAGKRARLIAAANQQRALEPDDAAGVATSAAASMAGSSLSGCSSSAALTQRELYGAGETLGETALDEAKLKEAMARERAHQRGGPGHDDRKRKYNSMAATDTTAEEMEAYHRLKVRDDDPMAKMLAAQAEADTDEEA